MVQTPPKTILCVLGMVLVKITEEKNDRVKQKVGNRW